MSQQPPPPGHYPPPGQQPPPPGYQQPGYYPPPGQQPPPGQGYYPPPGQQPPPGQGYYPPPGQGYYPPPGQGYYPPPNTGGLPTGLPPGIPGIPPPNHPLAAGSQHPPPYTPPQGGYPGVPAAGPYPGVPPSGPYPQGGYYPPPGQAGQYPSHGGYAGGSAVTKESESDSDPDDYGPRTMEEKRPISVKFINRSGKKILLFKIDKKGKQKKVTKLKDGKTEKIETYESTAFIAMNGKDDRDPMVIGDNAVYFASPAHAQVDIRREPADFNKLKSKTEYTNPVKVKFINRSNKKVRLEWVNPHGHRETKKELKHGRCWSVDTMEGHCWVCSNPRDEDDMMLLNYGGFYWPRKSSSRKERVAITEDFWDFSSSSSSSSSSDHYSDDY